MWQDSFSILFCCRKIAAKSRTSVVFSRARRATRVRNPRVVPFDLSAKQRVTGDSHYLFARGKKAMKIAVAVMVMTLNASMTAFTLRPLNAAVMPPRNSATPKTTVRRR